VRRPSTKFRNNRDTQQRQSCYGLMESDGPSHRSGSPKLSTLMVVQLANDLRNLLTVIASCADSIRCTIPSPGSDVDQTLAELDGAVDGAFYISRELFALVRPQPLEQSVIDVNDLVDQARSVIERVLGDRIRVSFNLAAAAPIVRADAVQLEWVLLNLAWNAADTMPCGGMLSIGTASVDTPLNVTAHDIPRIRRYIRLTISDTGRGMSGEARTTAFEPFFTTKAGGWGVGLTSVAVTIARLGG
jgi:two-component system cell cycle sensor histidine kinase/response regulator CckA